MTNEHIPHDFLARDTKLLANERRTMWVVVLTTLTMFAEIAIGYWSGSMALLADGWHMASHAGALGISVIAYRLARNREFQKHYTFGSGKIIPLGGYTSAIILAGVAVFMFVESVARIMKPIEINYFDALAVAVAGLLVNLISAYILHERDHDHAHHHGHHHDHNLRSAYAHVLADALTSLLAIGALLAGIYLQWQWLDPVVGIVGSLVILRWAFGLTRETVNELLDAHGKSVTAKELAQFVNQQFDVAVIDTHIWRIAPNAHACEIVVVSPQLKGGDHYRSGISQKYQFDHLVIEERIKK